MAYKHAFECKKCPETNTDQGCPCWVELMETNIQTNEVRSNKGCLFQKLPIMMIEVIKASNRPSAAVESMRNEIAKGFVLLNQSVLTYQGKTHAKIHASHP